MLMTEKRRTTGVMKRQPGTLCGVGKDGESGDEIQLEHLRNHDGLH